MPRPVIRVATTERDWSDAGRLLGDYVAWLEERSGVPSLAAVQPGVTEETSALSAWYSRPGHRLLVARQGGVAVGMIGIVPTEDPTVGEIVRLFARPAARGSGVGRDLLERGLGEARSLGFRSVVLETCERFMHEAIRLYEACGFERVGGRCSIEVDGMARYGRELAGDA